MNDQERSEHKSAEKKNGEMRDALLYCAHDLREPLRSVSNFIQILFSRDIEVSEKERETYINSIINNMNRLNVFVSETLSHYAQETQTVDKVVDLKNIICDIMELLQMKIEVTKATIQIEQPLPKIRGNYIQIQHIFLNLIHNALNHAADRPLVIKVNHRLEGNFQYIIIEDNGISINASVPDDQFREKNKGLGLGLNLVNKFLFAHNAMMSLDENQEGGCTVTLCFPALEVPAEPLV